MQISQNEYEDGLAELRRTHQYKMQLAQEEHGLLSKTLRERLIQSVTSKRMKLMRDKEQLDIADSSALLLNPNQFSLGNPSTPGGIHTNRKTRHTRRADQDDIGNSAVENGNGKKRSRKMAFEDTENDSAGPPSRPDNGNHNPQREAKAMMNYSQFEAPLYSFDRLFTEKDLAMNVTKAHKATFAHFSRRRAQNGQPAPAASAEPTNEGETKDTAEQPEEPDAAAAAALASLEAGEDGDMFSPTPSLFFYLPQKASQTYHATRSQRNIGLDILAGAATGATPFVASINAAAGKANPPAPPVGQLEETYANEDLALMNLEADNADYDVLRQRCLDKTSVLSLGVGMESAAKQDSDTGTRTVAETAISHAALATSVPMAKQASGGLPMAKTNSTTGAADAGAPIGGEDMRRTASSRSKQ